MEINKQLDLSYLETTFGGNKMIVNKVLSSFLDKTPQLITSLKESVNQNNWDEVKMIAHKMKSSFNTLGAKLIGELLAEIELKSLEGNKNELLDLTVKIQNLGEQALNEVKEELS